MIKQTEHLVLDYINFNGSYIAQESGVEISAKYQEGLTKICKIVWNNHMQCSEIHTYNTKLQDCITTWELYKEFIELVDEGYYRVDIAITSKKLNDYCE